MKIHEACNSAFTFVSEFMGILDVKFMTCSQVCQYISHRRFVFCEIWCSVMYIQQYKAWETLHQEYAHT